MESSLPVEIMAPEIESHQGMRRQFYNIKTTNDIALAIKPDKVLQNFSGTMQSKLNYFESVNIYTRKLPV
jgi:hypothetical protein